MKRLVSIRKAAEFFGVTPKTIRRWETQGLIPEPWRTPSGHRRYLIDDTITEPTREEAQHG
jgi:DNA-binding transcriptional MerR regulator